MRSPFLFLAISVLIPAFSASALELDNDNRFPGIKLLMSDKELKETGLDKLTDSEIQALDQWLIRYTATDAKILQKKAPEVKKEARKDIYSRIDGEFTGWSGSTVFYLKNGQVWKQRLRGKWRTSQINPEVIISRNALGFYELSIVGYKRKIGVKRIK